MFQIFGNMGASTSLNPFRLAKGQYSKCCTSTQITNSSYDTMSKSNIKLPKIFTWIALGDGDLYFSIMLVREANAAEEETT
jgi:hypothetical protein